MTDIGSVDELRRLNAAPTSSVETQEEMAWRYAPDL